MSLSPETPGLGFRSQKPQALVTKTDPLPAPGPRPEPGRRAFPPGPRGPATRHCEEDPLGLSVRAFSERQTEERPEPRRLSSPGTGSAARAARGSGRGARAPRLHPALPRPPTRTPRPGRAQRPLSLPPGCGGAEGPPRGEGAGGGGGLGCRPPEGVRGKTRGGRTREGGCDRGAWATRGARTARGPSWAGGSPGPPCRPHPVPCREDGRDPRAAGLRPGGPQRQKVPRGAHARLGLGQEPGV